MIKGQKLNKYLDITVHMVKNLHTNHLGVLTVDVYLLSKLRL